MSGPAEPSNTASVESGPVAARTGFDRSTSREREDARGAFERVYTNADGTATTELSAAPINYRGSGGRRAPIDLRLSAVEGEGWQNLTNPAELRFAQRLAACRRQAPMAAPNGR